MSRRRVGKAALAWVLGFAALRTTLWAPEVCEALPRQEAVDAVVEAADWIVGNAEPDGTYLYEYDRDAGASVPGYNLVRHAGVTMALYQLVEAGMEQYLEPADEGLDWMLERLEATGDGGLAFTDGGEAKLGAAALLTVALAHRRAATGDTRYDDTMRALGRFMVGQKLPSGAMLGLWDPRTGAPVPGHTSVFATGEANWALALLHEAFPEDGWDEPAWDILDYLALQRDLEEELIPAPWPDQWAAYSLSEMAPWGLEDHHIDYARRLAERFAFLVRFDAQRGTTYGGWTHGPSPRGGGTGTWVEGLASLAEVAEVDPRFAEHGPAIREALRCGAANLADRQVEAADGPADPSTLAVDGAWFYDDATRMDDQQHAASGILLSLDHRGTTE